jgi:hypothetical protein
MGYEKFYIKKVGLHFTVFHFRSISVNLMSSAETTKKPTKQFAETIIIVLTL